MQKCLEKNPPDTDAIEQSVQQRQRQPASAMRHRRDNESLTPILWRIAKTVRSLGQASHRVHFCLIAAFSGAEVKPERVSGSDSRADCNKK